MLSSVFSSLEAPVACVVHVGAGAGGDLPLYTGAGARRIVLAEADPECAAELRARLRDMPGVEIVQAAVSGDTTPRPFHRTSFSDLSSLRAPTALRELFPGLRIVSHKPVAPVDPIKLVADLEDVEGLRALVLEAPGESLGILAALEDAGKLRDFGLICLCEGRAALYDGAPALADIRAWLDAADYRVETETPPADPDRPWLTARPDTTRAALRAELAALREETARLGSEAAAVRKDAEATATELETLKADAGRREHVFRQETGRLTGERDAARKRNTDLAAERDTARKDAETAQAELETLRAEHARQEDTFRQETGRLTAERDAARNRNAKMAEEHEAALEAARAEAAQRRGQGHDEIMKAEGQIRLLRDLLLNRDAL